MRRIPFLSAVAVALVAGPASAADNPPTFLRDVAPILDRAGCSAGACHGKFGGAGGFALSLLTLAPDDDFDAVAHRRRVNRDDPAASRLLTKPSGEDEHKGGVRFAGDSREYKTILKWIEAGAKRAPTDPKLLDVVVEPARATAAVGGTVKLKVIAKWSDGVAEDVTRKAVFASSDEPVAAVSPDGEVKGVRWGAASIQVRFLGQARAAFVAFPRPGDATASYPAVLRNNLIDGFVFDNLKALNVVPSELSDDGPFCRRVFLDLLGVLPTPAELDAFVHDPATDKRAKLVDKLLARPEYIDLRTMRLADLFRLNPQKINPSDNHGTRSAVLFHDWIRDNVEKNRPYDKFVRDVLTARGKELESGPANYWTIEKEPHDRAETTAQVFLGVRLMCARCHKHPFDRWGTDDYWDFAAVHALVGLKGGQYGAGPQGYPQVEVVCAATARIRNEAVVGPRRGQEARPAFLGTPPLTAADRTGDPVVKLADWVTSPKNRLFARAAVNRLWNWHFGRGLVMPVDDMRDTSPEYVPGLLDALAAEFVKSGHDVKHLTRLIVTSRTYQLSSKPNDTNKLDDRFFSRAHARSLPAQVMLDILNQATGTAERFIGHGSPVGNGDFGVERFVQYPIPFPKAYFLDVFGASKRTFLADIDPKLEPSMLQALHLMNSDYVNDKIRYGTFARELTKGKLADKELVERAYLRTFCRRPTERELAAALKLLADSPDRAAGVEDLLWGLLTSREFLFNS